MYLDLQAHIIYRFFIIWIISEELWEHLMK